MKVALVHINYGKPLHESYQLGLASLAACLKDREIFVINKGCDADEVVAYKPDIIGIYAIEDYRGYLMGITEYFKLHTSAEVILGGPYPTLVPDIINDFDYIDDIFRGEAEVSFKRYVETGWKGNGFGGTIAPRLSQAEFISLDYPYRGHYLSPAFYATKRYWPKGNLHFMFSRGCPFQCAYCNNSSYNNLMGTNFRIRLPEQAVDEIDIVCNEFDPGCLTFEDDILTLNSDWFNAFMHLYTRDIGRPFEINTRVDCLSEEQIVLLKKGNCIQVRMGIESGSQKLRNMVARQSITDKQIFESFQFCHMLGIDTLSYNIIGIPGETIDDYNMTLELNRRIVQSAKTHGVRHMVSVSFYYPTRGTSLGDQTREAGLMSISKDRTAHDEYVLDVDPVMMEERKRRLLCVK